MTIDVYLNGEHREFTAPAEQSLSHVLHKGCRGVNPGCGQGYCGGCMVLINGKLHYSCQVPFFTVKNQSVITIEGVSSSSIFQDIFTGMKKAKLNICDFCAPARTLSFYFLLKRNDRPEKKEIQDVLSSINCSCTNYSSLKKALFFSLEEKYRRLHG